MAQREDKESRTIDYKEDAGFPTQRPSGPLRMGPKVIKPIPLDDDFVVVERPRSPSPPVIVKEDGEEEKSSPTAGDDGKRNRQKKPPGGVKFAQQNDIRVFKDDEAESTSSDEGEDSGDISKEETGKEQRHG